MKRLLILFFVSLILFGCSDSEGGTDPDKTDQETKESNTENEENPVISLINDRALEYGASVDDVKVNKDANNEDEFLVLITFNVLDKKDTKSQYDDLVKYSDDIAASLSKEYEEINTVVAFWKTVDEKGNILKRAYVKEDDGMHLDDEAIDVDYFE